MNCLYCDSPFIHYKNGISNGSVKIEYGLCHTHATNRLKTAAYEWAKELAIEPEIETLKGMAAVHRWLSYHSTLGRKARQMGIFGDAWIKKRGAKRVVELTAGGLQDINGNPHGNAAGAPGALTRPGSTV